MIAQKRHREIHALHSDAEHAAALREIESLWDATDAVSTNRLEVLAILVDAYEREHHSMPKVNPIDAILFRMDQRGLSRADLGRILGSRARATEVLARKRRLSLAMIRRLHEELHIPAEVLIADVARKRSGRR